MSGRKPWQHQAIESVPELSRRVGDGRFEVAPVEHPEGEHRPRRKFNGGNPVTICAECGHSWPCSDNAQDSINAAQE